MTPTLHGAIIGCGFFGQIQLEAWRRMSGVQIVAACDSREDLAREAAPRSYASAEEMLDKERLDFVDIATRPDSHLNLVRLAAGRGLSIICQKPMASTWEESCALARCVREAEVRGMIHENWRWQPWYRAVHQMIQAGDIGTPVTYTFRTRRADGMGSTPYSHQPYFAQMPRLLIYETLVHQIDTARFLFGDLRAVYAQARKVNPLIAGEDQAIITLRHDSLCGIVDGHRFLNPVPDGPAMGDATFEGDSGALRVEATGNIYRDGKLVWSNQVTTGYRGDSVLATQQHFINCLRSGDDFESEATNYLQTFGAVEAAYRSLDGQRSVALSELLCD